MQSVVPNKKTCNVHHHRPIRAARYRIYTDGMIKYLYNITVYQYHKKNITYRVHVSYIYLKAIPTARVVMVIAAEVIVVV